MKHHLIAVEGNIGVGKTTLVKKLQADLQAQTVFEEFDDNPFLPQFYAAPDRHAFQMEMYFMAQRFQQLKLQFPSPSLFPQTILMDFIFIKSLIFARVTLNEEEFKLYQKLFDIINPVLPQPTLVIYLYASFERLQQNIAKRGRSFEKSIDNSYLKQLHSTYLEYFRQQQGLSVLKIDVTHLDFVANEADYKWIKTLCLQEFPAGLHPIAKPQTTVE